MTTHTSSKQYTPAEQAAFVANRQASMQRLSTQLSAAVAAIQDGAQFQAYLRTQATFHRYSFRNALLIMLQCPHATQVAGYETWRQLKRQVRTGETGLRIYAPVQYKAHSDAGDGSQETRTGFRAVSVFDISQTEGEDLPIVSVQNLVGADGGELYAALAHVTTAHDLTLTHDSSQEDSAANGYYSAQQRTIYVKAQARSQMTKTLAHELAHALDPAVTTTARAEVETVAEGVAFMVLAHFGIDSSSYSFAYIADWNGSEDGQKTLMRCMDRMQKIAHTLIEEATDYLALDAPPGTQAQST